MATDTMSSTLPTNTKSPQSPPSNPLSNDIFAVLESVMRITLAGFGGALAGLSLSRRGNVAVATNIGISAARGIRGTNSKLGVPKSSNNPLQGGDGMTARSKPIVRRTPPSSRQYVDRELPAAWAMACMAFAGIIEFTRMVSPTSVLLNSYSMMAMGNDTEDSLEHETEVKNENDSGITVENNAKNDENNLNFAQPNLDDYCRQSLTKISDYVIGGSIAGALFQGSAVRTRAGARIDASLVGLSSTAMGNARGVLRGKPLSGLIPGAALGLMAGFAIVSVDILQEKAVKYFESDGHGSNVDENDDSAMENVQEKKIAKEEAIPEDIRRMSNEDLLKSIENLKRGQKEK